MMGNGMTTFLLSVLGGVIACFIYAALVSRNWRQVLDRLAKSNKARQHRALTRIIVGAVGQNPRLTSAAIVLMHAAFMGCVVAFAMIGLHREATAQIQENERILEQAESLLATAQDGTPPAEDDEGRLAEWNKHIEKLKANSRMFAIGKWGIVAMLAVFIPFLVWLCFVWLPRELVSANLSLWLEATLSEYVRRLKALSEKYGFGLLTQLTRWLEASDLLQQRVVLEDRGPN